MPIEIYTGKPGNGKTALMMERMLAESKKGERPIFAGGIDGLQPGIATVLADPRAWNDIDPAAVGDCTCGDRRSHAHVVPNGALVFIDEAWKWFGHLHDASRQATPKHVLDLAEHRHRGIDFVWTAQGPNQIYPFARPLIADHTHVVRRFGTKFIETFRWEELQEDVKSTAKRENALRSTRALPSDVFGTYKSADVHTIKRKIPLRVLALPLLLLVAGVLGWFAYHKLKANALASTLGAAGAASAAPLHSAGNVSTPESRRPPLTAGEYAERHIPRFGSMPWTAPAYDTREVTADPQLFCASSGAGVDALGDYIDADTCTCLTEQGTRYVITDGECRYLAKHGPVYNPYLERRGREGDPSSAVDARPARVSRAPLRVDADLLPAGSRAEPAAYGAMRETGW